MYKQIDKYTNKLVYLYICIYVRSLPTRHYIMLYYIIIHYIIVHYIILHYIISYDTILCYMYCYIYIVMYYIIL